MSDGAPAPRAERRLLALMLALVAAHRIEIALRLRDLGVDGSYYADIARHVAAGEGLVTTMSTLHQGLPSFPHPTPVYPLWPLLLGAVGAVVPFDLAVVWLAPLLSLCMLVAGYRLATRLAPEPLWTLGPLRVNAGHLLVVLFATSPSLDPALSRPYTEALAWTLCFVAGLRALPLLDRPTAPRGFEVGVWSAVLVLTRAQLALFGGAVGLALLLDLRRGESRRALVALVAGGLLGLLPQLLHIRSFVPEASPTLLLRFDAWQASDLLARPRFLVATEGLLPWLRDRARGVPIAWNPLGGGHSFRASFNLLHFAVPLALPLVRWPRSRRAWALAAFSAAGLLSLHAVHKAMFVPWNFGMRHAITAAPAILVSLVLLARHRWGRWAALGLVGASLALGVPEVRGKGGYGNASWDVLADWFREHHDGPVVLMGQRISPLIPILQPAGYHALLSTATVDEVLALCDQGVDYIVYGTRATADFHGAAFREALPLLEPDLAGHRIRACPRRPPTAPAGSE